MYIYLESLNYTNFIIYDLLLYMHFYILDILNIFQDFQDCHHHQQQIHFVKQLRLLHGVRHKYIWGPKEKKMPVKCLIFSWYRHRLDAAGVFSKLLDD